MTLGTFGFLRFGARGETVFFLQHTNSLDSSRHRLRSLRVLILQCCEMYSIRKWYNCTRAEMSAPCVQLHSCVVLRFVSCPFCLYQHFWVYEDQICSNNILWSTESMHKSDESVRRGMALMMYPVRAAVLAKPTGGLGGYRADPPYIAATVNFRHCKVM